MTTENHVATEPELAEAYRLNGMCGTELGGYHCTAPAGHQGEHHAAGISWSSPR